MSTVDDFSGKTILITGASSGIGEACARYLDSCGARLVLVARRKDVLEELAESLCGSNYVHSCDLSDIDNISSIFKFLKSESIKLDGLIHSAGIASNGPISQFNYQEAIKVFNINFFAFCEILKYCAKRKYMNEGAGIVALSSIAACSGARGQADYAATKGALEAYMRIAAKELMEKRIRLNALQPAQVATEGAALFFTEFPEFEEKAKRLQKLGLIDPAMLAKFIAYLVSDDGGSLTGLTIPVDAGCLSYLWME